MMKITMTNGVVIELSDGESIPAMLIPMIVGAEAVTATVAPVPPTLDDPAATGPMFLPIEEFIKGADASSRERGPDKCYLTKIEMDAMRVIREHPEGITSTEAAAILGVTASAVSSTINRIRTARPYQGSVDPLVVRLSGGLFKLTHLGARLKYLAADKRQTPKLNRELGWGRS